MTNALTTIERTLQSPDTVNQLILAGSLPTDERGKNEANKYIASVMGEIKRSVGTAYDITKCHPDSVRQTLIDSMRFKVPIDGRKMAHIDVRYNKDKGGHEAILQIDTNGFVAKIAEHYPDFHIKATPVFQGDDLEIAEDGKVKHKQKSPLCSDANKLEGMIVQASYTKGGRLIEEAIPVTKADLMSMKAASKVQAVWNNWTLERMKTAAIKRVCKWHFRTIQGLQDIVEYDNGKNYDLKQIETKAPTAADSINSALNPPAVIELEIEEEPAPPMRDLDEEGTAAARQGMEALTQWRDSLTDDERAAVKKAGAVKELTAIAKKADAEKNPPAEDDLF